ncbi:hypothetical protein D1610_06625 [Sphingomonas gilva]|uniref:Uncharacterized protein n=1 Tax=Sphingomonas gilva TaxID=2305907 RepID=A0A396RNS2_9SPHN|nr:hypothetical protein [Sphingomonas gilva]RHW18154.1 hypothetical protein D1610_06625 [Sphingomonas gilva]
MNTKELATLLDKVFGEPHVVSADPALELSYAMLRVLARRHGPDFISEVRAEIVNKATRLEGSERAEDRANASEIRSILDG